MYVVSSAPAGSCDSSFQETRNGLIIAAFVFSVLAVIFTGVAAIALAYSGKYLSVTATFIGLKTIYSYGGSLLDL